MKSRKNIIILVIESFLLLGVIMSCKFYNVEYNNIIKNYPDEFVAHFPKLIKDGTVIWTDNPNYEGTVLFLLQKDTTENYYNLKNKIKKFAKAIYHADDSCLLVINKFTTIQNLPYKPKAKKKEIIEYVNKDCLKNKLPVPNFFEIYENEEATLSRLPKEFDIYVLEAKKGLFWDEKHRSSGEYMPDYWKHGYSRGIAMNDKTHELIYWFVLW